jgi:hypothetical protein
MKIKEKWLVNALNDHFDRANSLKMSLEAIGQLIYQENLRGLDIWAEVRKRYNLKKEVVLQWNRKNQTVTEAYKKKYGNIVARELLNDKEEKSDT